jgi:hypothetical protein
MRFAGIRYFLLCLAISQVAACATDTIEDRRYGQQIVCHDGVKTMSLSNADGHSHIQHGDSVGPCPSGN